MSGDDRAQQQANAALATAAGQMLHALKRDEAHNAAARAQTAAAEVQAIGADRARHATRPGDLQQILPAGVAFAPETDHSPAPTLESVLRTTAGQNFQPSPQAHDGSAPNAPAMPDALKKSPSTFL